MQLSLFEARRSVFGHFFQETSRDVGRRYGDDAFQSDDQAAVAPDPFDVSLGSLERAARDANLVTRTVVDRFVAEILQVGRVGETAGLRFRTILDPVAISSRSRGI